MHCRKEYASKGHDLQGEPLDHALREVERFAMSTGVFLFCNAESDRLTVIVQEWARQYVTRATWSKCRIFCRTLTSGPAYCFRRGP